MTSGIKRLALGLTSLFLLVPVLVKAQDTSSSYTNVQRNDHPDGMAKAMTKLAQASDLVKKSGALSMASTFLEQLQTVKVARELAVNPQLVSNFGKENARYFTEKLTVGVPVVVENLLLYSSVFNASKGGFFSKWYTEKTTREGIKLTLTSERNLVSRMGRFTIRAGVLVFGTMLIVEHGRQIYTEFNITPAELDQLISIAQNRVSQLQAELSSSFAALME